MTIIKKNELWFWIKPKLTRRANITNVKELSHISGINDWLDIFLNNKIITVKHVDLLIFLAALSEDEKNKLYEIIELIYNIDLLSIKSGADFEESFRLG